MTDVRMLSTSELAKKLNISVQMIRRYVHEKKLRVTKFGSLWRFAPNDIKKFLQGCRA